MRISLAFITLAVFAACSSHETSNPNNADASVPPSADAPVPPTSDAAAHDDLAVVRTDLAGDLPGAAHQIRFLQNAWGLAIDPEARGGMSIWIAANGTDTAQIIGPDGNLRASPVMVAGSPSGEVYTDSRDLAGDELVFASESGQILGWQRALGETAAVRVDDSASGAIYKGLAIVNEDPMRLAATDFHNGSIDVYGPGYAEIDADASAWMDPTLPAGFAPFGIASFGGDVYVSYAKQDADRHDDVKGAGNGFVDVFSFDGKFKTRLISGGHLNSPWGMAIAPPSFHLIAGKLLIGNFGDGAINVYDRETGDWMGQLHGANGVPVAIDGLWAIVVGPKTDTLDASDRIFFTAGPNDEMDGLFGMITAAP